MFIHLKQTAVAVLGYWLVVAALVTMLAAAMPIDKNHELDTLLHRVQQDLIAESSEAVRSLSSHDSLPQALFPGREIADDRDDLINVANENNMSKRKGHDPHDHTKFMCPPHQPSCTVSGGRNKKKKIHADTVVQREPAHEGSKASCPPHQPWCTIGKGNLERAVDKGKKPAPANETGKVKCPPHQAFCTIKKGDGKKAIRDVNKPAHAPDKLKTEEDCPPHTPECTAGGGKLHG